MQAEAITKIGNKYQQGQAHFEEIYRSGRMLSCSPGMITGHCGTGHQFMRSVQCGREYCPDCGRDGSPIHARRLNRWMPKVKDLQQVGYLVVTIPEEIRTAFHDRQQLSKFRMLIKKKLISMGYKRGLMRWHFHGDCTTCNGRGCDVCDHTGAGRKWNPHLNIIIEEGYIKDLPGSDFDLQLRAWLSQYFRKIARRHCEVVYHYSYCETIEQTVNVIKYVTRSTFRIYNKKTAILLYRFTSTSTWGKYMLHVSKQEALDNNQCPICKIDHGDGHQSTVKWYKLNCSDNYTGKQVIHLKNGNYYALPNNRRKSIAAAAIGTKIKARAGSPAKAVMWAIGYQSAKYQKCAL